MSGSIPIKFMESFDSETAGGQNNGISGTISAIGWTSQNWGGFQNTTWSMQVGRFTGSQCLRVTLANSTSIEWKSPAIIPALTSVTAGLAYLPSGLTSAHYPLTLAAGSTRVLQVLLQTNGILLLQNSSGTTIATGVTTLSGGTWYHISVSATISATVGQAILYLNGVIEAS